MVMLLPTGGSPLPNLSEPIVSVTVLAVAIGSDGSYGSPAAGARASPSNSAGFNGLKGNSRASSSVAAIFDSSRSVAVVSTDGRAGPLTVGFASARRDAGFF